VDQTKPALGLTMFGVTTTCVQAVTKRLADEYDCLVFHATGVGGQSMEKLADSGLLAGVIDVSTTEVADEIGGGVLSAGPTRLDVFARHALPYVGSCGALDMVNFGAWETVPERFRSRKLYRHNPTVTLMRTTVDDCRRIGEFLAAKLNAMRGPVRFLIPEARRLLDRCAGAALLRYRATGALRRLERFRPRRRSSRLPLHLNDEAFADALVAAWREIAPSRRARARPADKKDHATHRRQPSTTACAPRSPAASRSSAAVPAPGCRPSARRPAASTSSSSTTPAATGWPAAARSPGLLAYGNANEIVVEMAPRCCRSCSARRCSPASTAPTRS
jgi:hypothetical protein